MKYAQHVRALAVALAGAIPSIASADIVNFRTIEGAFSANDMSPDGRWIVGETDLDGDFLPDGAYIYDALNDVMTHLPAPAFGAVSVSDDGSVVLGNMPEPDGLSIQVAAIWTSESGVWTSLGWLPNAEPCPSLSSAYELSADGTIAVGLSWDGCNGLGFWWTQETGMIQLEELANGVNRASIISADGSIIGGFAQGSFSRTPTIWNGATLQGALLDPSVPNLIGEIHGMSDDGQVLLGTLEYPELAGETLATVWGPDGEVLVGGTGRIVANATGHAMDIADNNTVVGFDFSIGTRRAWIWPESNGPMLTLRDWAIANGAEITEQQFPEVCQAISSDGSRICGHGFITRPGAWLIDIEFTDGCDGDADGSMVVDVGDISYVIFRLGNTGTPGSVDGDVNNDGVVNVTDVGFVIFRLGTDCR